jgi:hypothetical protein
MLLSFALMEAHAYHAILHRGVPMDVTKNVSFRSVVIEILPAQKSVIRVQSVQMVQDATSKLHGSVRELRTPISIKNA